MNNILAVVVPVVTPIVVNNSRGGSGSSPFEDQLMESTLLWLCLPWLVVCLLALIGLLMSDLNGSIWSKVERINAVGGIIMLSYTLGYIAFWLIKWLTYN